MKSVVSSYIHHDNAFLTEIARVAYYRSAPPDHRCSVWHADAEAARYLITDESLEVESLTICHASFGTGIRSHSKVVVNQRPAVVVLFALLLIPFDIASQSFLEAGTRLPTKLF